MFTGNAARRSAAAAADSDDTDTRSFFMRLSLLSVTVHRELFETGRATEFGEADDRGEDSVRAAEYTGCWVCEGC